MTETAVHVWHGFARLGADSWAVVGRVLAQAGSSISWWNVVFGAGGATILYALIYGIQAVGKDRRADLTAKAGVAATERLDSREERRDVVVHYEGIIARLNADIARLAAEMEMVHDDSRKASARHEKEFREMHARFLNSEMEKNSQHATARVQRDSLLDQITRMQDVIESMRSGAEPWSVPDPTLNAWVIFEESGKITAVGSNMQPVLGWTEHDLLRKPTNIKALIPPDRHVAFDELMAKVRVGEVVLDPREVRPLQAICKSNDRVPIYLTMRKRERDGRNEIVATIRERYEVDVSLNEMPVRPPDEATSGDLPGGG